MNKKIIIFGDKKIRRIWNNNNWWFCVADIVSILTESRDVKQYIKKMRQRDESLSEGWVQIVHPLKIETKGGNQMINCATKEGIFRIIQSIPSKKAEPFKLWLAKVGSDRIDEIENPELMQERMKSTYEKKGYSRDWIDKRLRGIVVRQELSEERSDRGVENKKDDAILTNEISKAAFGKTISEYKEFKNLNKENLRYHMDDWELILTMVGEKATTDITKKEDSLGFDKCRDSAVVGGSIAANTRKELEKTLGKSLVSDENYVNNGELESKKEKEKRKELIK